jgi:HPt (histidine-containing phosphotransfer) domain-containing protein
VSFEELLKTLRTEYLASLPEKIKIIEEQIKTGAVKELRDSFHKLKGTGKTYGMPEISDLCEVTEAVCIQNPQRGSIAALESLPLMRDILKAHQAGQVFALEQDARFQSLRKLLQN